MVAELEHTVAGKIRVLGIPTKLSETPGEVKLPPPILGEHTEEILRDLLGQPPEAVESLREQGVI